MGTNQPFYYRARKAWYLMVDGENGKRRRVKLGSTRTEAYAAFAKIQASRSTANPPAIDLMGEWFASLEVQLAAGLLTQSRFDNLTKCSSQFLLDNPGYLWSDVTPEKLLDWVVTQDWSPATAATRIGYLKQWAKWVATTRGLRNLIADVRKPSAPTRLRTITIDEHRALVQESQASVIRADRRFGLYLTAMYYTGARPGELAGATPEDIQDDKIVLRQHKNAGKGKRRAIYLTGCARTAVMLGLACGADTIFTGRRARMSKDGIRQRLDRLREKSGISSDVVAYSYRHTFATNALTRGVPIATLAELMGTSVAMISKHYGHLEKSQDHLKDAMGKAVQAVF